MLLYISEGLEKRISTDKLLDYIEWCEENEEDAIEDNIHKYLKHIVGNVDFRKKDMEKL